jgi:hypothetical protein
MLNLPGRDLSTSLWISITEEIYWDNEKKKTSQKSVMARAWAEQAMSA